MRVVVGDSTGLVKTVSVERASIVQRAGTQGPGQSIDRLCYAPLSAASSIADTAPESIVAAVQPRGTLVGFHVDSGEQVYGVTGLPSGSAYRALSYAQDQHRFVCMNQRGEACSVRVPEGGFVSGAAAEVHCKTMAPAETSIDGCAVSDDRSRIAFGGRDFDLKVCDSQTYDMVWQARNVPVDRLQLAVPIWVSAVHWLDDHVLVVGTGHRNLRVYDIRAQRRPVKWYDACEARITTVLARDLAHVYYGDAVGNVCEIDMERRVLSGKYKGATGSITGLALHGERPLLATASLDRFARVYSTTSRACGVKVFTKQQLHSILFSSEGPIKGGAGSGAGAAAASSSNKRQAAGASTDADAGADADADAGETERDARRQTAKIFKRLKKVRDAAPDTDDSGDDGNGDRGM